MCVPEDILGVMTFWNDETFWVFKMKKREATSIVWYLGKCFAGFRNLGKSVFLDGIMMCVPEWLFGVMTFWNDETFWVFKMKKREATSIVWYLGMWLVGLGIIVVICSSLFKRCAFPSWLFGGQTFWNEECFWVLKSWKREVASILLDFYA